MTKRACAAEVRRIERALLRRLPDEALCAFLRQEQTARDVAQEFGSRESYDWHLAMVRMVRGILEERERPRSRSKEHDSYSDLTVDDVPDSPAQPCSCSAPCRGCSRPSTRTENDGAEDVPVCDDCAFTL